MCHQILQLQNYAFAAGCITELLFAFLWDLIASQIHRFQRPVDLEHTSQRLCSGSTNLIASQLQYLQGAVGLECIAEGCCAFVSDAVGAKICRFQRPVDPDGQRTKVFNGK